MQITHKIQIDLLDPGPVQRIYVKQGDYLTRAVEITLLSGGQPWVIPTDLQPIIRYHIHDLECTGDVEGFYQQLPNGDTACQISGNIITIIPLPNMLSRHAVVSTDVIFISIENGSGIATATFEIYVNRALNMNVGPLTSD